MIDEALQFALDYCQESLAPEETVRRGQVIIRAIHGRLGELDEKEGATTFIMGGVLRKLKKDDLWKKVEDVQEWWTWDEFCRQKVGRSSSSCYQKMDIWEKWNTLAPGESPSFIDELGWSVAAPILRAAKNREEFDHLVSRYKELGSREKLIQEIQEQDQAKPQAERTRKRRYFKLSEIDEKFLDESIEKAAEIMGRELHRNCSPEEALVFLAAQWRESLN